MDLLLLMDTITRDGDYEEENLLVDPSSGDVVEPVFVEPTPTINKEDSKPKKKEQKKKEEKKVDAKESVQEKVVAAEQPVAPVQDKPEAVQEKAPAADAPEKPEVEKVVQDEVAVVVAVEKATVQLSAAPPSQEPKPERRKIEIVDVPEIKSEEQEEKKKKKPAKEKQKKSKSQFDEIVDVVRMAQLSNSEAQGIVDILLLKQTGKEDEAAEDWIEPGKETESKKMARMLSEVRVELEEEQGKSSSLEKKMIALRKELNESKSVVAGHKREVEEVNTKKNQEISSLNSRLQQLVTQMNSTLALNRQLETTQAHYQSTINNLQTQLSQVSVSNDPQLLTELEQLKTARTELTASNSTLQQKFTQKCDEVEALTAAKQQLEVQLTAAAEAKQQLEAGVEAVNKQQLEAGVEAVNKQQLEAVNKQQLDSQLSAVTAAKQALQLELSVLKDKLTSKEEDNARLLEENERLSEQVASSVERPAAEGEEAIKVNGHQEVAHKSEESNMEKIWEEKYSNVMKQLQQSEAKHKEVESALETTRAKCQEAEQKYKEVETRSQEAETKYKEAESKHKEAESKHKEAESMLKAVSVELETSKAELGKHRTKNDGDGVRLKEYQSQCATVFRRLFPAIPSTVTDLTDLEKQARTFIQEWESSSESAGQTTDLQEEIQKLESQITNYKSVLEKTERMLSDLQSSVEVAENDWKNKLEASEAKWRKQQEDVESECSSLKTDTEKLRSKNVELNDQLTSLNIKINELEVVKTALEAEKTALEAEKSSSDKLAKKCAELQQLLAAGQQHINNHTTEELVSNGTQA